MFHLWPVKFIKTSSSSMRTWELTSMRTTVKWTDVRKTFSFCCAEKTLNQTAGEWNRKYHFCPSFWPFTYLTHNRIGLHCLYTSFLGSCRCFQLLRMTLCFSASFVSPTTFFKITLFSKTVSISLSSFSIRSSVSPTLTCRRQQTMDCYFKVPFLLILITTQINLVKPVMGSLPQEG